jgi:glycosyltransferase involved in cell wall biosynthesis
VLVCVSDALKDIVVREAGVPASKILVVPNAVDCNLFDPERYQALSIPTPEFTVGYVGSLIGWQGLDLLLRALSIIRDQDKLYIRAVLVGDGPARADLEQLTQELELVNQTMFLGRLPREQIPGVIAHFDICFAGHLSGGSGSVYFSPLKLYEYLAMAKPVIASATEDARRLVADGETGFLFPTGDLVGLIRALRDAHTYQRELREMGKRARERIVAHHSWTARVRSMIAEIDRHLAHS